MNYVYKEMKETENSYWWLGKTGNYTGIAMFQKVCAFLISCHSSSQIWLKLLFCNHKISFVVTCLYERERWMHRQTDGQTDRRTADVLVSFFNQLIFVFWRVGKHVFSSRESLTRKMLQKAWKWVFRVGAWRGYFFLFFRGVGKAVCLHNALEHPSPILFVCIIYLPVHGPSF